jgi:hypothetical protein
MLMPPKGAYSVWWFFDEGSFSGWYVNLEAPVVTPQRRWQWKDAEEFDRRIGHPLYFDSTEAKAIRAEGERLIELIEAGDFPFDGAHTGFRPDPAWPWPRLRLSGPRNGDAPNHRLQ